MRVRLDNVKKTICMVSLIFVPFFIFIFEYNQINVVFSHENVSHSWNPYWDIFIAK